jgi:hypothetical protein
MLEVTTQEAELGLPLAVMKVHEHDGGQVYLRPVELSNGLAKEFSGLVRNMRFRDLQDLVAHASKLGAALLGLRLGRAGIRMDPVWIPTRSINLA